jgi:hypothetical protein
MVPARKVSGASQAPLRVGSVTRDPFQPQDIGRGIYYCRSVLDTRGNQYDFWVLKLKKDGSIDWQKTYGGGDWDIAFATEQTSDGGFIVTGSTGSFGGGDYDVWVLKLNVQGSIVWQKTYGTSSEEYPTSVVEMPNGGYRLTGTVDFLATKEGEWILMLDLKGNIVIFQIPWA